MSGGGGRVMKDRMGQSVCSDSAASGKDIKNMEVEFEALRKELVEARTCRQELKESISQTENEISKLQTGMKKSKSNYDAYMSSTKSFTSQVEEQKKKIKAAAPDKNKIKTLENEIEDKKKNFNKASKEASLIEEKIKSIQDKILAITKGRIGNAQKKVDKLSKEVSGISDNMIKSSTLIKKTLKNIKKAEEKVASLQKEIEDCLSRKEELTKEYEELGVKGVEVNEKKNEAKKQLKELEATKKVLSKELQEFSSKVHRAKSELIELKNQLKMIEIEVKAKHGHVEVKKSELAKLEMYEIENESTDLPTLTEDEIAEVNINALYMEIGRIEKQMEGMNPDISAIAEFKKKDEMYKSKQKDLEDTVAERDHYKQHYEQLRKRRMDEFMKGFNIVSLKVKELYQMLTLGGDAELELVDSLDPFSEGIEFSVRPLRKSWKSIRNLSGGEKTLSSLSLVFALHYYRSTPFFVMDEIDAALDFRNVSIIASYIKDCTKNAQFIVISLRENMFQLCNHLVGIYKTNNRTNNVILGPALLSMVEKLQQSLLAAKASKEKSRSQPANKILENHKDDTKIDSQKSLSDVLQNSGSNAEDLFDKILRDTVAEKAVAFNLNPEGDTVTENAVAFSLNPEEDTENVSISQGVNNPS